MTDFLKVIILIIVIAAIFAGGYFLGEKNTSTNTVYKDTTRLQIDTLTEYQIIEKQPIRIIDSGTIRIIKDTVILIKPFVASLDTICSKDTLNVSFTYPLNRFDISLKQFPDTCKNKIIVLTNYREIEKERAWYEIPAYAVGGLLIGFGLGSIK